MIAKDVLVKEFEQIIETKSINSTSELYLIDFYM